MGKKIVMVGAGAVGGYVGAHMARDGVDVTFIDGWPDHVDTINEKGISVSGTTPEEAFTTPAKALHLNQVQSLSRGKPVDIAIVSVKSYDTAWCTTMIAPYLAPGGFVISLQNCINEDTIASIVGWGKTVGCIASSISVAMFEPGKIERYGPRGGDKHTVFRIGEPHGRITLRIEEVAQMLKSTDSVKTTTNLWGERWSKLVINGMGNGVSAASGLSGKEMVEMEMTRRLSIRLGAEAIKVGRALGYVLEGIRGFPPEKIVAAADGDKSAIEEVDAKWLQQAKGRAEGGRPSMGQDMLKGRRTEIEAINGYIVAKAREIGMDAPVNDGLVKAVQRVERGEAKASPDVLRGI